MSQKQFAKQISDTLGITVTEGSVSRWLSGRTFPSKKYQPGIVQVLQLNDKHIFNDFVALSKIEVRAEFLAEMKPGITEMRGGNVLGALQCFEGLQTRKHAVDPASVDSETCTLLIVGGHLHAKLGQLALAQNLVEEALECIDDSSPKLLGQAHLSLAFIARDKGKVRKAEGHLANARMYIAKMATPNPVLAAKVELGEAAIFLQKAQREALRACGNTTYRINTAREQLEKVMHDLQALDDDRRDYYSYVLAQVNIGAACILQNNYGAAKRHLEGALANAQRSGYMRLQAAAKSNLGLVHLAQHQLDHARVAFSQVEQLVSDEPGHQDLLFHNEYHEWRTSFDGDKPAPIPRKLQALRKGLERWTPERAAFDGTE